MITQSPEYLYKVLSSDNWQASQNKAALLLCRDDDAFIHFSTEEQLDRILSKYWSDISEYVVLKIKREALPGDLVYETNPGGTAKYYHLYQGSIPLSAIVESKMICKAPMI